MTNHKVSYYKDSLHNHKLQIGFASVCVCMFAVVCVCVCVCM